jgi:small conductance mechanosensitive channel
LKNSLLFGNKPETNMEQFSDYAQKITDMVIEFAPNLLLAVVVFLIGLRIINKLMDLMMVALERSKVAEEVWPFISTVTGTLLKILLLFSAASIVGIETTSFVAVLAAAGFAVGMALQGSLSNFAAGVMILVFRPYRGGDLVQIEGEMGHVREVQIFNTIMEILDHKTVIVPNAMAIGGIVTNLSTIKYLRVDLEVSMPYEEDFERVEAVLLDAVKQVPGVLEDPAPQVGILQFDSHNIVLAVRPYANSEDYWNVYFAANRAIKRAMSDAGVKMAYSEGVEMGPIGR